MYPQRACVLLFRKIAYPYGNVVLYLCPVSVSALLRQAFKRILAASTTSTSFTSSSNLWHS